MKNAIFNRSSEMIFVYDTLYDDLYNYTGIEDMVQDFGFLNSEFDAILVSY